MSLIGPAIAGFLITIALMLALRPIAFRYGLLDRPGGRKNHVGDVPLIGGIAMFGGIVTGLALISNADSTYAWFVGAGALLLVVGVIDDRNHLGTKIRLGAQAIAAFMMIYGGGFVVHDLGDLVGTGTVSLGAGSGLFTVLITITVINAFNFMDGVDGLAACLAAIAISVLAIVSAGTLVSVTSVGLMMVACILGFLLFNFPSPHNRRVRTFMGDAGSTLLGLFIVWLTVRISQGEARAISPIIGLWFVLIPVADIFACFFRRIRKGKSPMQPGREHLHHVLQRGRFSIRHVLLILTCLGTFYAGLGILGSRLGVPDVVMFGGWVLLTAFQYPLVKSIALSYRSKCWRRLREAKSLEAATALPLVSLPDVQRPLTK